MAGAPITLNRADLSDAFPGKIKVQMAFEQLFSRTAANTEAVTAGVDATQALTDATVVTLSNNDTLTNERVLAVDPAFLALTDHGPGNTIVLSLLYAIATNGGYRLDLNLVADTTLKMPPGGAVPSSAIGPYANDAAAAAAGVEIGEWYAVTGGNVAWRVT